MASQTNSKDKILQCAREMFVQEGYQSTSVDDILERSGVAKSNFYYHFKTKDDLAFAVLDIEVAEHLTRIQCTLRNPDLKPKERLTAFFQQTCEVQVELYRLAGCPFGNFAATLPNAVHDGNREVNLRNERFRVRLNQLFWEFEQALGECLHEGSLYGDLRSDIPVAELASMVIATVEGLLVLTKTHRDPERLRTGLRVVEKLLRMT